MLYVAEGLLYAIVVGRALCFKISLLLTVSLVIDLSCSFLTEYWF